jgi:hypothetical protein
MCPRTCEKLYDGLQMAIHSLQVQPSIKLRTPSYEVKQHHKDVIYKECSNMNVEPMARGAGTTLATDKQETGCIPDAQRPTHSTMRKENPPGPQTTADLFQRESINGSGTQHLEESCGGLQIQHDRGAGNERRSNMNVKHKEKLMMKSVNQNNWRTTLYSPKTTPKAPNKGAQHIDDKLRTEAHYAPRPRERDRVENMTRWREKELTTKRQWSQCDIHHKTINATQGHVVNTKRSTGGGTSTNMICRTGKAIQKPACNDNDDWSSSGPECGAKNDTEQLSEHSDELSEALSDVREPDEDHTGSLSETVHMACM